MTTLATGLDQQERGTLASAGGRVYFANDFDALIAWDGQRATAFDAGIAAPATFGALSASSGGSITEGSHRFRYRYLDRITGYISNPSPEQSLTIASPNQQVAISITASGGGGPIEFSADTKVTDIIVEMTLFSGEEFFRAATATNAAGSVTVDINDLSLSQQIAAASAGDFGHEQPPLLGIIEQHKGRLFGVGSSVRDLTVGVTNGSASVTGTGFSEEWDGRAFFVNGDDQTYEITAATPTALTLDRDYSGSTNVSASAIVRPLSFNRLYWSKAGLPESWDLVDQQALVLNDRGDRVRGLMGRTDALVIFGEHSVDVLSYDLDPALGRLIAIPTEHGLFNQHCLVKAEGEVYGFGPSGFWRLDSARPSPIGQQLLDRVRELWDTSQSANFHGCYDPQEEVIHWWFTAINDAEPQYSAVFEVATDRWWLSTWDRGITASAVVPASDGSLQSQVGDEYGYRWWLSNGRQDGVPPTNPTVLTVDSGATDTVVPVTQALDSGDLDGVIATRVSTLETALISSNTADTLTLASPGLPGIGAGETVWLGVIPVTVRSKWIGFAPPGPTSQDIKHWTHLRVEYLPSEGAQLLVRARFDFESAYATYTFAADYDKPPGVVITDGSTVATLDLSPGVSDAGSGVIYVPLPRSPHRAIQWEIISRKPDGALRVLDVAPSTMPGFVVRPDDGARGG